VNKRDKKRANEGNGEEKKKVMELIGSVYVTDKKFRLPACIDERPKVYDMPGTYDIYHLALENSDDSMNYGIYANGLLVESCSKNYLRVNSMMKTLE
jgi:hypothetical protein